MIEPTPPEGFESWLDLFIQQHSDFIDDAIDLRLRKDLATLRAYREAWESFKSGESLNNVVERNLAARLAAIEKEYQ